MIVSITIAASIVTTLANLDKASDQVVTWRRHIAVERAGSDERLVLVCPFALSEGVVDVRIHEEIIDKLKDLGSVGLRRRLRIRPCANVIPRGDNDEAVATAQRSNAVFIIWGEDTGVKTDWHYWNLDVPDVPQITVGMLGASSGEIAASQLRDPEAYTAFVLYTLPTSLAHAVLHGVASSAMAEGDYAGAAGLLRNLANDTIEGIDELELGRGDLYLGLAMAQEGAEQYSDALESLDKAEESGATGNVDGIRGHVYLSMGRYTAAVQACETGLEYASPITSDRAAILICLGLAFRNLGELDKSLGVLNEAVELVSEQGVVWGGGPGHFIAAWRPLLERGITRNMMGDYGGAIVDYDDAATKIDPPLALYLHRAAAYYNLEDYRSALTDVNYFLSESPAEKEALRLRGRVCLELQLYGQAIADFGRVTELSETPTDRASAMTYRGLVYAEMGRRSDAISEYTKALKNDAQDADALINRGLLLVKEQDYEAALHDLNASIRIGTYRTSALLLRGQLSYYSGELDSAIADLGLVISDPSAKADDVGAATYYRGHALTQRARERERVSAPKTAATCDAEFPCFKLGINRESILDLEDAIRDYSGAIEADYRRLRAFYWRGKARLMIAESLWRLDQPAAVHYRLAVQDLGMVLSLDEEAGDLVFDAYYSRGGAQLTMGDFKAARRDYEAAILVASPEDDLAAVYNNLGVVCNFLDDYQCARESFQVAASLHSSGSGGGMAERQLEDLLMNTLHEPIPVSVPGPPPTPPGDR